MLQYISVKNFAIIENIEVQFNDQMTALTGETGAGKSLLIDAIGLLLGDRATSNIVRTGEQKAIVEGVFTYKNESIRTILQHYDIPEENNELIIKRQITPSNNNVIKCNGETITLGQLKEITNHLADIHTQHDTHRLINQETYIDIIDGFHQEETNKLQEEYQKALKEYKSELKEFKRLQNSNDDLLERLDLLRFQQQELESFNLDVEEEIRLTDEVKQMRNFDKIFERLSESKALLSEQNSIDRIYDAAKGIESISTYSDKYTLLYKRFNEAYYELNDAYEELESEINSLDFDPRLLDHHQERLNDLDRLKRKYRKELPELIDYLTEITKDIDNIDHYDEVLVDQENKVKEAHQIVCAKALELTKRRQETSRFIEEKLIESLTELELKKAEFVISFEAIDTTNFLNSGLFLDHGVDVIDFMITVNPGEPLKSLSKSASGGEMSRIMLALKSLLASSLQLSLMIFDEIDTGVSGFVANQVAKKMHQISSATQVICITHIPQVAALSDHHLFISKYVEDGRTKSRITLLDGEHRVREIASMISGDVVTEAAMSSARELLTQ